jgi:hypothetical protein
MSNTYSGDSAQHVMLLYDNDSMRDDTTANYVNESLKKGSFTVYASVNAHSEPRLARFLSRIANYKEHIARGNLLVVRLKTFYDRAMENDIEPFEDLKAIVEEIARQRISKGRSGQVVMIADCADSLSRNEMFDECVFVEKWWQEAHSEWLKAEAKITVICPHPAKTLEAKPFAHRKRQLSNLHNATLRAISR